MEDSVIEGEYEKNTGAAIVRMFLKQDPLAIPGVLVASHGPFAWGGNAQKATENVWIPEIVARLAYFTVNINPQAVGIGKTLHDRHFLRKHGEKAYYDRARAKE